MRSEVDKDGAIGVLLVAAKCDKMQIYLDWIIVMSDYLLDLFLFVSYVNDKGNVERLQAQLLRKDSQLTESRLEALSSAHQLHTLRETVASLRGEMTRLKADNERMYTGRAGNGAAESPRKRGFNNVRSSDSGSSGGRSGANFSSSTFNNKEGLPGFLIGTDGSGVEFPGFYRKVMINILPLAYKYCSGKFEMTSQLLCF